MLNVKSIPLYISRAFLVLVVAPWVLLPWIILLK